MIILTCNNGNNLYKVIYFYRYCVLPDVKGIDFVFQDYEFTVAVLKNWGVGGFLVLETLTL